MVISLFVDVVALQTEHPGFDVAFGNEKGDRLVAGAVFRELTEALCHWELICVYHD